MIREVAVLVDLFKSKLGSNLRSPSDFNPFWHTGNPTNMRSGNLKDARPWEWLWRVADGTSPGHHQLEGPRKLEAWDVWFRRHIKDHMFYM